MERVLDEIEILLPVLGFDVLRPAGYEASDQSHVNQSAIQPLSAHTEKTSIPEHKDLSEELDDSQIFLAVIKKAKARAFERAGEFVVMAGSTAYRKHQESQSFASRSLRQSLQENGDLVLDADPELFRFVRDVSFGSPSAASSLICGYSDSGPRTWKLERTGQSYGEWRKRKLGGDSAT